MVVIDQFYQIVEKKTSKIGSHWKVGHILACFICAISGFITSFCFGRVLDDFNYNCILNANVVFDNNNATNLNTTNSGYEFSKPIRAIDLIDTMWGAASACNFTQFTPLMSAISAVIWGMFFIAMSKGGAGYTSDLFARPWSIIYPCIFFTIICFITFVISGVHLKQGILQFCIQFKPEFNNTGCVSEISLYSTQFHEIRFTFSSFYPNIQLTMWSAEIGIWSWAAQLILCLIRLFTAADFNLQLVTIISKDDEEIEKVVEFEEISEV